MGFSVLNSAGQVKVTADTILGQHGAPGEDGLDAEDRIVLIQPITSGASTTSEFSTTTTGNIDDLDFSNANVIRMNNASLATIRGLKAGTPGQQVTIVSIGAGQVDLANQNANSSANNRLINAVTSINTSLSPGVGSAIYEYDGTTLRWRLISHSQGAPISITSPVFTASAGTWTGVTVATYNYTLVGSFVLIIVDFQGFSLSSTPTSLTVSQPYTFITNTRNICLLDDNGTFQAGQVFARAADTTHLTFFKLDQSAMQASVSNSVVQAEIFVQIL